MFRRRGLISLTYEEDEPLVEFVRWDTGQRVVTRRLTGDKARRWVKRHDLMENVAGVILLPVAIPYVWWYNRADRKAAKKGLTP